MYLLVVISFPTCIYMDNNRKIIIPLIKCFQYVKPCVKTVPLSHLILKAALWVSTIITSIFHIKKPRQREKQLVHRHSFQESESGFKHKQKPIKFTSNQSNLRIKFTWGQERWVMRNGLKLSPSCWYMNYIMKVLLNLKLELFYF